MRHLTLTSMPMRMKMMKEKNDTKKRLSIVYLSFVILLICMCIHKAAHVSIDFDFLSVNGQEIVKNHSIPKYIPNLIKKDMPFAMQQWLYCIYCYFLSKGGSIAITVSNIVIAGILLLLLYQLYRNEGIEKKWCLLINLFSIYMSGFFLLTVRPECTTNVLLAMQVYGIEKYKISRNKLYLALLPIATLLEVNLHGSMWFIHYCLLIPYFLPFGMGKFYPYKKAEVSVKDLWFPVLLMTTCLLINPYGYKMVLYPFEAMTNGMMRIYTPDEMFPAFLYESKETMCLFVTLIVYFICVRKHLLRPVSLYIASGLLFMMVMQARNLMFLPFVHFYLISDIFSHRELLHISERMEKALKIFSSWFDKNIKEKKRLLLTCKVFLSICCISIGGMSLVNSSYQLKSSIETETYDNLYDECPTKNFLDIKKWLDNNASKDSKIGNKIQISGMLMTDGYNIYIDSRPEIQLTKGTSAMGDMPLLKEYVKLFEPLPKKTKEPPYSNGEIQEIVEFYDFDYVITIEDSPIVKYMRSAGKDTYQQVRVKDDEREGAYLLFAKIDE